MKYQRTIGLFLIIFCSSCSINGRGLPDGFSDYVVEQNDTVTRVSIIGNGASLITIGGLSFNLGKTRQTLYFTNEQPAASNCLGTDNAWKNLAHHQVVGEPFLSYVTQSGLSLSASRHYAAINLGANTRRRVQLPFEGSFEYFAVNNPKNADRICFLPDIVQSP